MSVCAAPTCSHQSFDGSSYYVDVDVDEKYEKPRTKIFRRSYNVFGNPL
jgi:hypothetical protein